MLKISYAAYLCLSVVILAQFALEMCLAAQNHQKICNNPYFSVEGHFLEVEHNLEQICKIRLVKRRWKLV